MTHKEGEKHKEEQDAKKGVYQMAHGKQSVPTPVFSACQGLLKD